MQRPTLAPATLAALLLVLAACTTTGGGGSATAGESHGASHGPASSAPEPTETAGEPSPEPSEEPGETVEVELAGFAFSPGEITVPVGTTVRFVNNDGAAHTVTHGQDGRATAGADFDKPLPGGRAVTVTFDEAGTFNVTCTIHPTMNMTVVVEG